VRGQVEDRDQEGQRRGEMQRAGLEGQPQIGVEEGEVEVRGAAGEAGDDEQRGSDGDLQREAAAIVADAAQGPEEQGRPNQVEEGQQPDGQGEARVKQVLGSAEDVPA